MKNQIEKFIKENQEEFLEVVLNFIKEKSETKQKKSPKKVCHFKALGKTYDSDIFTRNYESFLLDVSKILSYNEFKTHLQGFVRKNKEEFPDSFSIKTSMIKLHNGGIVSSYSATEKKIEHIKGLCKHMGVSLTIIE